VTQHRIAADERRKALIEVARELCAHKGFEGVTTRELAKAAGVSQSLLYKHFPSKESLYAAIREDCINLSELEDFKHVLELRPSTATLVLITQFLMSKILSEGQKSIDLLIVRSLIEDGEFVLTMHKDILAPWFAKVEQSLKEAIHSEEAEVVPSSGRTAALFTEAIAMGLMLIKRPNRKTVELNATREQLVEKCVWFALLGIGVKADAIRRHYGARMPAAAAKA
jgi:AcrR family transcriptional regulator